MQESQSTQAIVGRFAPSPTGELHFGSLLAAVASYLQAKTAGGHWLIRIEDIDPPREVPGSAERILKDLHAFGLQSDLPVLYQSQRTAAYRSAAAQLIKRGLAFNCGCSRADLPASGIYAGTCRNGLAAGKTARSIRLKTTEEPIRFLDHIQGQQQENLAETVGDFVIWRADGLPAYQLAAAVDDAFQEVSEVTRGADLLHSTARQIHVLNSLGLPAPEYAHHPVACGEDGRKLSKRRQSDPVGALSRDQALKKALHFLGQPCPEDLGLKASWNWALENWRLSRVPRVQQLGLDFSVT
jgi:glutamyl-Q tRNA(Asp) synthetase